MRSSAAVGQSLNVDKRMGNNGSGPSGRGSASSAHGWMPRVRYPPGKAGDGGFGGSRTPCAMCVSFMRPDRGGGRRRRWKRDRARSRARILFCAAAHFSHCPQSLAVTLQRAATRAPKGGAARDRPAGTLHVVRPNADLAPCVEWAHRLQLQADQPSPNSPGVGASSCRLKRSSEKKATRTLGEGQRGEEEGGGYHGPQHT